METFQAQLRDKKILILGIGKEGVSTLEFLRKIFPEKTIGIADQNQFELLEPETRKKLSEDKYVKLHLGDKYLEEIENYNFVIKTPGIPISKIKNRLPKDTQITSQTKIFFDHFKGTIIGITGTKGKSTTTSLIFNILKDAGRNVQLVGNIGNPALLHLENSSKEDIAVYELSSYQLEDLEKSPHIAVVLNIYPEHLNYHGSFEQYVHAKENITRYQSVQDFIVYNSSSDEVKRIASESKAKKIPFDTTRENEEKIVNNIQIKLRGDFNRNNVLAAVAVGKILNVPEDSIVSAIESFIPLPHRLEYVGEFQGIKFYNDSLATIPEATIAALDALESDVATLIVGGFDRGLDFTKLGKKIVEANIKTVILFPTTGQKIIDAVLANTKNPPKYFSVNDMKEAVLLAFEHTEQNKICLMSPASPSFGVFKNYQDRGEQFVKEVQNL